MSNGKLKSLSYRRQLHDHNQQQSTPWKRIHIHFVVLVLFGCSVGINFLYIGNVGPNRNGTSNKNRGSTTTDETQESSSNAIGDPSTTRHRLTMPPRASSFDTAGYVHIGKTGGSTISKLLRSGCNSFDTSPCRIVPHETQISKLVEHYYHIPDFWRLPTSNHKTFIVSVRDVYDRSISALLYHHPDNSKYYNLRLTGRQQHFGPLAYQCFQTLETFASLLVHGNSTDCNYPYRHNVIEPSDCVALACATIHGKVRFFSHLYFGYRNIVYTKLPIEGDDDAAKAKTVYVLRQERLWEDWTTVNQMLGQTEPVAIPSGVESSERNISGLELPVSRAVSKEGRQKLCKALETEYIAYFRLLARASNLDKSDLEYCRQVAEKNCPNLDTMSMIRNSIEHTERVKSHR